MQEVEWPSPVVARNRAAARTFTDGPAAALADVEAPAGDPTLAGYPYLAASRADLLRRLGRRDEARTAYRETLTVIRNPAERALVKRRLDEVGDTPAP